MRDRMTQLEEEACGWKGIHQFPTVDFDLGRLCLEHSCLNSLLGGGNQEKETTCCRP